MPRYQILLSKNLPEITKVCLHQKLIIIKRLIFHEERKNITFGMASLRVDHCLLFSLEAFLKTSEGETH